jgi:hypothetical protein
MLKPEDMYVEVDSRYAGDSVPVPGDGRAAFLNVSLAIG